MPIEKNEVKEVKDAGQKAVETIASAKPEEVKQAMERKFPDAEKINEDIRKEEYEKNKSDLIKNIVARRLNPEFHDDKDPRTMEYNKKLLLTENPHQVKAYVAYYNLQIAKDNIFRKTNAPIINVDEFMKAFESEQPKPKAPIEMKSASIGIAPEKMNQEVGKFIDIAPEKQQTISEAFGKVMAAEQKITKLTLNGYADATQVTKVGSEKVQEKFAAMRKMLVDKGISAEKLPAEEYFKGIESMGDEQKQKVLNEGWAYARAMMQIAFLPQEQIRYINENTTTLTTNIDAKPVGGAERGDQYTGGGIEMQSTGSDRIIRELEAREARLLKMCDQRQVNYMYRIPGDRAAGISDKLHFIGGIHLSENTAISGRKEGLSTFIVGDTESQRYYNGKSGWDVYGQDAYVEPNPNVSTLNIIIPKNDPRITAEGMNIPAGFDGFISALTEFTKNTKGDKDKKAYAESMIQILQTYKEVEADLNKAKEIRKVVV